MLRIAEKSSLHRKRFQISLYEAKKVLYNIGKFVWKVGFAMRCLKCGKQAAEKQVFCPDCLRVMEEYPVKPGTAIQLPLRNDSAPAKKTRRRQQTLTPEERTARLRFQVRRLTAAAAVLALLVCLLTAALAHTLLHREQGEPVGRNYTTVTADRQP